MRLRTEEPHRQSPAQASEWLWPMPADRAAFKPRTKRFSFSCTRPVTAIATIAGTKVRESTNAVASAMITVIAIGMNVLPSTPVKVRSGT